MSDDSRIITGKAYYCGDFINTDVMAPGRYEPYDTNEELARHALEDYEGTVPFVNPGTANSQYTVIFAGEEFGCGSSRDTAPRALRYAGARVVIARSFARIFFRNCVNMGMLVPIRSPHPFDDGVIGAEVSVNLDASTFAVHGETFTFPDFGPVGAIIEAGGLTAYTKQRLRGQVNA